MRTPIVAGNWKMNNTVTQARRLVSELLPLLEGLLEGGSLGEGHTAGNRPGVEVVVCPPFTALGAVAELLEGTQVRLGAQDVHWEESGAFTGEVSPLMLKELGCHYVIVGHSERRSLFGEDDSAVARKLRACLDHGMTPILCVGETLQEREAGLTRDVVGRQVREALRGLGAEMVGGLVVAYEPVWAIGTGRSAGPEDAGAVATFIRTVAAEAAGGDAARRMRVQYGGSVKPENAAGFFAMPEIDGALVGGASLDARAFAEIARRALR